MKINWKVIAWILLLMILISSVSCIPLIEDEMETGPLSSISLTNRTPNIADVDPSTISPINNGYIVDLDGDSFNDYVIMTNNTLYFSKGNNTGPFEKIVPLLHIDGNLMAYTIQTLTNKNRPSILFWDSNRKGYLQENLGNSADGLPYFGDVESQ